MLQIKHFRRIRSKHDAVAFLENDALEVAAERFFRPDHIDDASALALEGLGLHCVLPGKLAALRQDHLGKELHPTPVAEKFSHRVALGKKPLSEYDEVSDAECDEHQAEGCYFEQGEGLKPGASRHAVDQQVGRSSDQRACAAEDRDVRQRD